MIGRMGKGGLRMFFAAAAIFVIGAGVAWAAIPGSSGVINGCYEKKTGILRVIDAEAGKRCLSFETPISWNQKGPKGDQGAQGIQGPAGLQGPKGDPGDAGAQGPQGPNGDTGATGPQGPQGPKGDTGATGPQGPQGLTGATGPQGPAGPAGTSGYEIVHAGRNLPALQSGELVAACPAGKKAVGGGGWAAGADIIASAPHGPFFDIGATAGDGWFTKFYNGSIIGVGASLHAWAVCVNA